MTPASLYLFWLWFWGLYRESDARCDGCKYVCRICLVQPYRCHGGGQCGNWEAEDG
jgi:hypothetical protein